MKRTRSAKTPSTTPLGMSQGVPEPRQISNIADTPVSTAAMWCGTAKKLEKILLPSGVVIEVRKLDMIEQASAGKIELPLLAQVINSASKMGNVKGWESLTQVELETFIQLLRDIAVMACVNPPVGEAGMEGVMDVKLISTDDLSEIFKVAVYGGGAASLSRFR